MEWHFRNRSSSCFSYIDDDIQMPMSELWSLTLPGSIVDTPIYAEGSIFVATTKDIHKLNPVTGKILWSVKPDTPIQSSPAYDNGRIYFSSHTLSTFYCVNSENGDEIWRTDTGVSAGSCYIDGDKLFLKCGKGNGEKQQYGFACYSLVDKKEIWFHACEGWNPMRSCAISEGILVYGDMAGNVYGIESSTGKEIWKKNITDWFPVREDELGKLPPLCV